MSSVEWKLGDIQLEEEVDLLLNLTEAGQELCALQDGQLNFGGAPVVAQERDTDQPLWEISLSAGTN